MRVQQVLVPRRHGGAAVRAVRGVRDHWAGGVRVQPKGAVQRPQVHHLCRHGPARVLPLPPVRGHQRHRAAPGHHVPAVHAGQLRRVAVRDHWRRDHLPPVRQLRGMCGARPRHDARAVHRVHPPRVPPIDVPHHRRHGATSLQAVRAVRGPWRRAVHAGHAGLLRDRQVHHRRRLGPPCLRAAVPAVRGHGHASPHRGAALHHSRHSSAFDPARRGVHARHAGRLRPQRMCHHRRRVDQVSV